MGTITRYREDGTILSKVDVDTTPKPVTKTKRKKPDVNRENVSKVKTSSVDEEAKGDAP